LKNVLLCSLKTIERAIVGFYYALKRISLIPERRNTPQTIELRRMYANTFLRVISKDDGNNCFFIDEVDFQLSICRTRGRSRLGTLATTTVPGLRNKNINACAIISKHGILHYKLERTAYNTTKFSEFLDEVF
ncbi:hypothetical protein M153_8180002714, partial [Pseudoloma neurophilia]